MIIIFCDFSAKILALFSKTNIMIIFRINEQYFEPKTSIFVQFFFDDSISKIITLVPGNFKGFLCPEAGLPDFSWHNIPKWGETYQMTTKYPKRPQNIPN
jgi:hypothetical protein